jgi:cytochrome c-type biogenesis protein CcmH
VTVIGIWQWALAGLARAPWRPAALLRGLYPLAVCASILAHVPARAVQPDEMLQDPALEARARQLSQQLRCLVCQNQSIDDSNAPLARDLRVLLRDRLTAGDSDGEVLAYLAARYGEFVLLRPPFSAHTALLWIAPFLLLAGCALLLMTRARTRLARLSEARPAPLSQAERERLERLLKEPPSPDPR